MFFTMARIVYEDKNLRLEYVNDGNYIHETWWGITTNEVSINYSILLLMN